MMNVTRPLTVEQMAQQRRYARTIRQTARLVAPPQPGTLQHGGALKVTNRWATVFSVPASGGTACVQWFNRSGLPSPPIVCAASYTPTVGDVVNVQITGTDPYITGKR